MKLKKLASLALAGALTLGLLPALSSPALADGDTNTYTIDIPSALTVTKTGWNDQTAGIKASGTLADGKKLTVTATSPTNNFNLKSGDNSVAYKLAAESEKKKSYSDATAKTTWEFSKDDLAASGGKTETVGVILEDITNKPAGTYRDTVTFTAAVEALPTLAGVTLTDGMIIEPHCNVGGGDNWVQFKYVADDNEFVPNFNSYNDVYSKSGGPIMQQLADQWADSTLNMHETPNGNFYLTQTGNTVHLRADDGINMNVIDLQLDFDNMTYTQLYKQWYKTVSGSFSSIKIGDTTITASQMTAQ